MKHGLHKVLNYETRAAGALDPVNTAPTCNCGKKAVWFYLSDPDHAACDECVPRGCSCTSDLKEGVEPLLNEAGQQVNGAEDYEYERDDRGRQVPCCEWDYYPDGLPQQ